MRSEQFVTPSPWEENCFLLAIVHFKNLGIKIGPYLSLIEHTKHQVFLKILESCEIKRLTSSPSAYS